MGHRYFVEQPVDSASARLQGAESHHLLHVMRARPGEQVILFDGTGREFLAQIERLGRTNVELTVLETRDVDRELPFPLVVGACLPKADRQRWLIEKLVELGVSRFTPLLSERSVVHPDQRALSKLRRAVIEGSKQCGRNRLMEITELTPLSDFTRDIPNGLARWLADLQGSPASSVGECPGGVALLVGPEGGFTPEEVRAANQLSWQNVSLGPRTLRIETAAIALTALVTTRFP